VARLSGTAVFSHDELGVVEMFARSASVALAYGEAQAANERLAVLDDQDRIARDLHDRIIQRLYAIGLGVQATQRMADMPVLDRLSRTVADIDETIADIRATIYDLQPQGNETLAGRVRAMVYETRDAFGFLPRVACYGPPDADVPAGVADQLIAVLREALTNVIRHARASAVDVAVSVGEELMLTVSDNGKGLAARSVAGEGLRNMTQRARGLGGELSVSRARPSGTRLEWRVPIPASSRRRYDADQRRDVVRAGHADPAGPTWPAGGAAAGTSPDDQAIAAGQRTAPRATIPARPLPGRPVPWLMAALGRRAPGVLLRDALGHHHAPCLDDQFGEFGRVDRGEPDLDPVVSLIRAAGHHELRRLGRHQRGALLLGKAEAQDRLVAAEREVRDPPPALRMSSAVTGPACARPQR
jgi:two-component sensor histidine kinase